MPIPKIPRANVAREVCDSKKKIWVHVRMGECGTAHRLWG
jgi:hypothetical protein